MNLGEWGELIVVRLLWASLAMTLAFGAALLISKLTFMTLKVKVWAWRLAIAQGLVVLLFNPAYRVIPGLDSSAATVTASAPSASPWMAALWTGLTTFWLVMALAALARLVKDGLETRRLLAALPDCAAPLSATLSEVKFRLWDSLSCPVVAFGWRPQIAAPSWCWKSTEAARLAIAHEEAHIRHGDLIWQTLASLVKGLFWFHPLAGRAFKELSFWQECVADESAIRSCGCSGEGYAETLVDIVAGSVKTRMPLAVGLGMQARDLGRRLEVAVDEKRWHPVVSILAAGIVLAPALIPWRPAAVAVDAPVRGAAMEGRIAAPSNMSSPVFSPAAAAAGG